MSITPRKNEVAAVVKILEDESHPDATAAAKAVIKQVFALLQEREMAAFSWRIGPGAPVITWGPFTSPNEAQKWGSALSTGGEGLVTTLYSPTALTARVLESEEPRVGVCTTCGHPWGTHQHEKKKGVCMLDTCSCTYMTK